MVIIRFNLTNYLHEYKTNIQIIELFTMLNLMARKQMFS